jgi:hypothetical protein
MSDEAKEREAFERDSRAFLGHDLSKTPDGIYANPITASAYAAWQAGRRAALAAAPPAPATREEPCRMDAPDGPECWCGDPSAVEAGLCAKHAREVRAAPASPPGREGEAARHAAEFMLSRFAEWAQARGYVGGCVAPSNTINHAVRHALAMLAAEAPAPGREGRE